MSTTPTPEILEIARQRAQELVDASALYGVVVTISQKPREPLAMGNYESVVEVRAANPNWKTIPCCCEPGASCRMVHGNIACAK